MAKRLRGRSFYLSLLGKVVADWLVRQLGLSPANIMFVGGGQFDLLIPLNQQTKLQECQKVLEGWLLEQFYGELGLQVASVELAAADFGDMRRAYKALSRSLEAEKLRKWADYLPASDFMIAGDRLYHRCRVCHLTPRGDPVVCPLCREHARIGQRLPHVTHLAFAYQPIQWPQEWYIRILLTEGLVLLIAGRVARPGQA